MKVTYLRFDPATGEILGRSSYKLNTRTTELPLRNEPNKLVAGVDFPEELLQHGIDCMYKVNTSSLSLEKLPLSKVLEKQGLAPRPGREKEMAGKIQEVTKRYQSLPERPKPREDR